MLRRSVLCALALCALVSLAGCGANRLAGPQVNDARARAGASLGDHPQTDPGDQGGPMGGSFAGEPSSAADTLRAGDDGGNGRRHTDN